MSRTAQVTIGVVARIFLFLFRRYLGDVRGVENVPRDGPFIIAANHSSTIDDCVIYARIFMVIRRRIHFLARSSLFSYPLLPPFLNFFGVIPTVRKPGEGGGGALEIAEDVLNGDGVVAIYPEGTRSMTGELQEPRTGVARLVVKTGAPVLPVGLTGAFEVWPKGQRLPTPGKIDVVVGKPLYFDEYYGREGKEPFRAITGRVMAEIRNLLEHEQRI